MYFKDLSPYSYYLPYSIKEIRNIGWLDKDYHFSKGDVPKELCNKLREILKGTEKFNSQVNLIRGIHPCTFCGRNDLDFSSDLGSCEIWIPDDKGEYFAAPSQVIHYIEDHGYIPPLEFIHAAIDVDLQSEFNAQKLYDSIIQRKET